MAKRSRRKNIKGNSGNHQPAGQPSLPTRKLYGPLTLDEILEVSPDVPAWGGGKWAVYSMHCCWWTSFPKDLAIMPGTGLPCCPHCGSVLMQAPLEKFVEEAKKNPAHYGLYGLDAFVLAHSRNIDRCYPNWDGYNQMIWAYQRHSKLDWRRGVV